MEEKMNEIKLNIQAHADRDAIVLALANSGYSVRVVEEGEYPNETNYFVVFEPNN